MKKVIEKGYTLEISSWENDGDHSATKTVVVATEKRARELYKMCTELFCSSSNRGAGIGNLCEGDESEATATIVDFVDDNPEMFPELINRGKSSEDIYYSVLETSYNLLGGSEFYICRVCESVSITFSEKDIYLQEVIF